jgi:hypothetical protein
MRTRNRLLLVPALVAAAFAVTLLAATPAHARVLAVVDEAVDEPGDGVRSCNGTNQEAAMVQMNDLPTTVVENAGFLTLPGATISFTTPANDRDQIIVIFSAEARVLGQPLTYTVPVDFLQIQILLDGIPMPPLNDLTFTTGAGESDAAQTCHRPQARDNNFTHTVEVQYLIVDQDVAQNLTATIDDWTLHVEINN